MLGIIFNWEINLVVITSCISIVFLFLTFIMTKRINKKQSGLIDYEIKNNKFELEDRNYAKLRITQPDKSTMDNCYELKIENYGKCKADNINIRILTRGYRMIGFNTDVPRSLEPEAYVNIDFLGYFFVKKKVTPNHPLGQKHLQSTVYYQFNLMV